MQPRMTPRSGCKFAFLFRDHGTVWHWQLKLHLMIWDDRVHVFFSGPQSDLQKRLSSAPNTPHSAAFANLCMVTLSPLLVSILLLSSCTAIWISTQSRPHLLGLQKFPSQNSMWPLRGGSEVNKSFMTCDEMGLCAGQNTVFMCLLKEWCQVWGDVK